MIQLQITMTGRSYGKVDTYKTFAEDTKTFDDLDAATAWLLKEYGKSKRQKMYCDRKNGESFQTGWIYCFNNADWSHSPVTKWRQQDWVEFQTIETMNLGDL